MANRKKNLELPPGGWRSLYGVGGGGGNPEDNAWWVGVSGMRHGDGRTMQMVL